MRILMVAACPLPWSRGTPIRIHRMAEALQQRGHDVHMATYPLGDLSQPIPYKTHRVASHYVRMNPDPGPSLAKLFYLDPLLCMRIRQLLGSSERFDVIHAHHYEGLLAALVARKISKAVPIIYDAHTLLQSELPSYRFGLPRALTASFGRCLDKRLPGRADHVIAVSDRMLTWFGHSAGISSDRISVIPNGVEHEHFGDQVPTQNGSRTGPHIVFAGNLAEYQGIDLLLQAFLHVREVAEDAHMSFLTSSHQDDLLARIGDLGIADAVSVIDVSYALLPSKLATATVLVNPRIDCDGIPQKLLNYMATGRPIVSFKSSASLLDHEKSGLIVPDGDVRGFADAVLRIIREPELGLSLGRAAQTSVVANYSWSSVAEKVELLYQRLIAESV